MTCLQHRFPVAGAVALEIDRYRQAGDVARQGSRMDRQCRSPASQTEWPNAEVIDTRQKVSFKVGNLRVMAWLTARAQYRLLPARHSRRGGTTYAETDNQWGTGSATSLVNGTQHRFDNAIPAIARLEHRQAAHILRAAALGHHGDFEPVTGHYLGMNHRWGVVAGIHPGCKRLSNHRLPQVSPGVALTYPFLDGGMKVSTANVSVLPHIKEDHRRPAVLAQWQVLLTGDTGILQELPEDVLTQGRFLGLLRLPERGKDILSQFEVSLLAEPGHNLGYCAGLYLSHIKVTSSPCGPDGPSAPSP